MTWPTGRWWLFFCAFGGVILTSAVALAQFASPTGKYAGTAGASCAGLGMQFAWPDANGQVLQCVSNVWTIVSLSGSTGTYLGASASATNPARSSGELTTGLFSAGSGLVDVSSLGTQVGEFSSTGLNLGTSVATTGALKLGGHNGISFPSADTNGIGYSIAIGQGAMSNMPAMPVGTSFYNNIAIGYQTLNSASMTTAAFRNTAVGFQALQQDTSGNVNTAMGFQALTANTSGSGNTALGYASLLAETTGSVNTGIGEASFTAVTTTNANTGLGYGSGKFATGANNTAIGNQAYQGINGSTTGSGNTAVGILALGTATTGSNNTVMGASVASTTLQTGTYNILIGNDATTDTFSSGTSNAIAIGAGAKAGSGDIAIGYQAYTTPPGDSLGNIAIGYQTLNSASMTTAAINNVAVGYQALSADTSGASNTAVGWQALRKNTTGTGNNAVGAAAMANETTGQDNNAMGKAAMQLLTIGSTNQALGSYALQSITTGNDNTAVGHSALNSITTSNNNVAMGSYAGLYVTGTNNTAVGRSAMVGIGTTAYLTGSYNVALGRYSLQNLQGTAGSNTGLGANAGGSITTGSYNVALGYNVASTTLQTGTYNILIGNDSTTDTFSSGTSNAIAIGYGAKAGTGDIAIGYQAYTTPPGDSLGNIAIGYQTLNSASMTTAAIQNTAVGYKALAADTSGNLNSAFGNRALFANTTGTGNNAFGLNALFTNVSGTENVAFGNTALFASTGSFNSAFGSQALKTVSTGGNNTAVGHYALALTTGSGNTATGNVAGAAITSGGNNTILGYNVASTTLNAGSNNILIGTSSSVDTPAAGTNNFLNIGNTIFATGMTGTLSAPAGNVGIGTATPTTPLQVYNANSGGIFQAYSGASPNASFTMGSTGLSITRTATNASTPFTVVSADSASGRAVMEIQGNSGAIETLWAGANGNVGIGTASPARTLDVTGSVHIAPSTTTPVLTNALSVETNATDNGIRYTQDNVGAIWMGVSSVGVVGTDLVPITFKTGINNSSGAIGTSGTEWMRITTAGSVGIGTTSPNSKLDVAGALTLEQGCSPSFVANDLNIDSCSGVGRIQAGNSVGAAMPLLLNPYGGSSAYVGIGTTAPASLLTLGANTPTIDFYLSNSYAADGARILSTSTSGAWNTSYLDFQTHANNNSAFTDDMVVKGGNVGIGTTSPLTKLEVNGNLNLNPSANPQINFSVGSTIQSYITNNGSSFIFCSNAGCSNGEFMTNGGSTWNALSDQRIKQNIRPLSEQSGLQAIGQLNPVTFNWKDVNSTKANQIGFIAQQVQQIFPDLISTLGNTTITLGDGTKQTIPATLGINSTGLIPPIVKAVQELKVIFDGDHGEIVKLKADNDNLRAANEKLEKRVEALEPRGGRVA